jgi:hypothetical protein
VTNGQAAHFYHFLLPHKQKDSHNPENTLQICQLCTQVCMIFLVKVALSLQLSCDKIAK